MSGEFLISGNNSGTVKGTQVHSDIRTGQRMTQTDWKPRTQGIIEVLPEEIADFEEQVKKFQSGEWEPNDFMAFRLRQGVYGQRQVDEQMLRIKAPFGAITADQLEALGEVAEKFAPLLVRTGASDGNFSSRRRLKSCSPSSGSITVPRKKFRAY